MTKTLVLNGAVYDYTDAVWDRILNGEEDVPLPVMRHMVRYWRNLYFQATDENAYWQDVCKLQEGMRTKAEMELVDLKRKMAMGEPA